MIRLDIVDAIDDRCKRRAFSGAGRAREQNDSITNLCDFRKRIRQLQRVEGWNDMRNDSHDDRERTALLKNVYAETALARESVAEVGRSIFDELSGRVGVVAQQRHRDHLRLKRRQLAQTDGRRGIKHAVDLDLRLLTAREVKIADVLGNEQHLLNNGRYI